MDYTELFCFGPAYLFLLVLLAGIETVVAVTQVVPKRRRLAVGIALWVAPQLQAIAAWAAWLYASRAVDFFDDTIRWGVPIALLIVMAVGTAIWAAILSTIARAAR